MEQQSRPPRLPLIFRQANRDSTADKDARLVNGMAESRDEGEYHVYKRPGFTTYQTVVPGGAVGRGVRNWNGDIYAIFGADLYKNGVSIFSGLDTTNGRYTFDATLGATPNLFFHNGVKGYTYNSGAGVVQVTDADYPGSLVKGSAYIDGYMNVMTPAAVINSSDANTPSAWNPLNTITAQIEPDTGVFVSKQLVYVIAFKDRSIEVFYDAGNPTGSPLGPVQGAKVSVGCRSGDSVATSEGILFWISKSGNSSIAAYKMEALKAEKISDFPMERILKAMDYTTIYSWTAHVNGHRLYSFTSVASNMTWVYDYDSGVWSKWTDTNGNYLPFIDMTVSSTQQAIFQHESNGKLYLMDMGATTDDGSIITTDIYTPNYDAGLRHRKHLRRVTFIGDQTPGSILSVRYSSDDYRSWSSPRIVDMGDQYPQLNSCGTFVRRAYHIQHASATPFRISSVEMYHDVGTI